MRGFVAPVPAASLRVIAVTDPRSHPTSNGERTLTGLQVIPDAVRIPKLAAEVATAAAEW